MFRALASIRISGLIALAATLLVLLGAAPGSRAQGAPAGAAPLVYVADRDSSRVTVIDGATMQIVDTLNTGGTPYAPVLSPDGTRAYVSSYFNNRLYVVDTANGAIIKEIAVGGGPGQLAINPAGTRVYVPSHRGPDVYVIDATNNTHLTSIPTGSGAHSVSVSPDGTRALCPNFDADTISIINAQTNQVIVNLGPYDHATQSAFSPTGDFAYVSVMNENRVAILSPVTNTETGSIPGFNRPGMVKFSPDGARAYVLDINSKSIAVVDTGRHSVIDHVPLAPDKGPPQFMTLSADGAIAFVTSWINETTPGFAQRVDLTTGVITSLGVGLVPYGITVFPGPPPLPPFPVLLNITPNPIRGGKKAVGQVTLNRVAESGGVVVRLYSSNRKLATPPRTVTVPKGQLTSTFKIKTKRVKTNKLITVRAVASGRTASSPLTLTRRDEVE